nr:hypothetical protein Iba_chr03dCG2780 [Ipomoea batatas]
MKSSLTNEGNRSHRLQIFISAPHHRRTSQLPMIFPPPTTARRMPLPGVAARRCPPSLPVSTAGRYSSSHAGLLSLVRCHIFVNILLSLADKH